MNRVFNDDGQWSQGLISAVSLLLANFCFGGNYVLFKKKRLEWSRLLVIHYVKQQMV